MEIQLHYQERGEGTPLILLHGNAEQGGLFSAQIEDFSQHYRVLAPDTRGHGLSPRGTAPFSLYQFADDLKDFMDQRDIDKAILLGFSDGANISMLFALKYPERVHALILSGGNIFPEGLRPDVIGGIRMNYENADTEAKREMNAIMAFEPDLDPNELWAITAPTLVMAGTEDVVREEHTRLIAEHIPNAQLYIMEGDHFLAYGQPEAFNAVVWAFLEEIGLT